MGTCCGHALNGRHLIPRDTGRHTPRRDRTAGSSMEARRGVGEGEKGGSPNLFSRSMLFLRMLMLFDIFIKLPEGTFLGDKAKSPCGCSAVCYLVHSPLAAHPLCAPLSGRNLTVRGPGRPHPRDPKETRPAPKTRHLSQSKT